MERVARFKSGQAVGVMTAVKKEGPWNYKVYSKGCVFSQMVINNPYYS